MRYLFIILTMLAGCNSGSGDSNDQDGAPIRPDPLPQVEHDVSIVRAELHPWDDDTARLFLILQNDGSQRLNFYITGVSADAYYDGVTIGIRICQNSRAPAYQYRGIAAHKRRHHYQGNGNRGRIPLAL